MACGGSHFHKLFRISDFEFRIIPPPTQGDPTMGGGAGNSKSEIRNPKSCLRTFVPSN